ncbi:MAG: hypothetical protein ACJ73N_02825, partial [Bryobacteraceae bacterium]
SGPALAAPAGTTPARAAPALGGGCPLQQGEKARPESRAETARPGPTGDFRFRCAQTSVLPIMGRTVHRRTGAQEK